ncbi:MULTISPECIES: DUF692 family multinuclear iron-containing protein [unclassified Acinetobacter]|uniref:multinuclear nonheme iron-dependent oxidase n=1 Tax=Acinetobacter sp. TUM15521 TaxID=2609156 RepID=UPI00125072B0|nr:MULTISPECIES: DUF692 family multinuclear iron-containing protein [unclassified Acinetobacter]
MCHGLSLSIGGPHPLNLEFIQQVKNFLQRYQVPIYSEHLSYTHDGGYLYDLLPIPMTEAAVDYVAERILRVQDILGQRLVIENVSTYLPALEKQISTRAAPTNTENTEQKVISSQSAVHEVAKQQSSHKVASLAATSTAAIAAQSSENKVKQDIQADQSSQMLTENPLSQKQQTGQVQSQWGGVNTAATQQELARAPESQVDRDEPVQVSSVDVLSFGKLAYDDRELRRFEMPMTCRFKINRIYKLRTFMHQFQHVVDPDTKHNTVHHYKNNQSETNLFS